MEPVMEAFKWTDKYRTHIRPIDKQHRELFERLNRLTPAVYKGECKKNLREPGDFFGNYIEEHLGLEEELMRRGNYPDYVIHVLVHDRFRKMFRDFMVELDRRGGDSYLAIQIEKDLRRWWENHILKSDMRYVPHISAPED